MGNIMSYKDWDLGENREIKICYKGKIYQLNNQDKKAIDNIFEEEIFFSY